MPFRSQRRPTAVPIPGGRTTYGHTWWGVQWLQALTQIDHENRLPRGRTYANRGAVLSLDVKGGHVQARVQGSRSQPYAVDIEVPAIAAADASRLVERLTADAGLIGRLLNRELDAAVLEEARQLKIAVFPERWRDLRMRCSCPDSAVPCKHLAAVVYMLSREIDGDPFLVFSLRGLDLPALMASHGVHLDNGAGAALPDAADVLFAAAGPAAGGEGPGEDPSRLDSLDFTTLPNLREALWRVLPASPVFFRHGDFRAVAQRAMVRVARHARQVLETVPSDDDHALLPEGRLQLVTDAQGRLTVTGVQRAGREIDAWADLMAALADIAPARLADLSVTIAALHAVRLLALHLLAQGAAVPQVFAVDAGTVAMRWCPAALDATVRAMIATVKDRALKTWFWCKHIGSSSRQIAVRPTLSQSPRL